MAQDLQVDEGPRGQEEGSWLPFAIAARRLGASERTLRRHIAEGRYVVRHDGRRVAVFVPAAQLMAHAAEPGQAGETALVHAIEALSAALEAERARSDRLEERLRSLEFERSTLVAQQARPAGGRAVG